jgi:hypothetical protein
VLVGTTWRAHGRRVRKRSNLGELNEVDQEEREMRLGGGRMRIGGREWVYQKGQGGRASRAVKED